MKLFKTKSSFSAYVKEIVFKGRGGVEGADCVCMVECVEEWMVRKECVWSRVEEWRTRNEGVFGRVCGGVEGAERVCMVEGGGVEDAE